ncbi:hypothetical protein Slin15195_G108690 [Septoria linicola]|uniref:Uncharacterized protein n=1 Tax=Septoria linicola TaxID=215465 RepID=A0A9Q9B3J4_9PEZI|nr:hypothetical protein Slin14017_G106990 [Septoria linicola]USW57550.1 hypothetical protein Slin15195_G108690 [Septoria linicola]
MQIRSLFLLALAGSAYAKDKLYSNRSLKKNADPKALQECLESLKTDIEAFPNVHMEHGYLCADRIWQVGASDMRNSHKQWTNKELVDRCYSELLDAAKEGVNYMACMLGKGKKTKMVGWSPIDSRMYEWQSTPDYGPKCALSSCLGKDWAKDAEQGNMNGPRWPRQCAM